MSVVGWARIVAGGAMLGVGSYLALMSDWGAGLFLGYYHERYELEGIGFDDLSFVSFPASFVARLILTLSFILAGYRLLRRAEGDLQKPS